MSLLLLAAHVLLVTSTPAIVVWVVSASAARATGGRGEAGAPRHAGQRLWIATLVTWAAFAVWASQDARVLAAPHPQPQPLLGLAELGAFAVLALAFGLPALWETAKAATDHARHRADHAARDEVREATLRPRSVTDYLPAPLPVLPLGFAVLGVGLVAALWEPGTYGRSFLAWGLALAGVAFAGLYALWIREEACGPDASGPGAGDRDRERRQAIRRIFGAQAFLVAVFVILALVVVRADWASHNGVLVAVGAAVVGGAVGVLGCAYALASGLGTRKLEAEGRATLR